MNTNSTKVDITPFMAVAFANNGLLTNEINRLYEKDKFKAYEAATKSNIYSSPILTDGSINKQILARKALGLIELDRLGFYEASVVLSLLKKGWKAIYTYIEKVDIIDPAYVSANLVNSNNTDDYYIGISVAVLSLSTALGKDMLTKDGADYKIEVLSHLKEILSNYGREGRFSYNAIKKDKDNFKKAVDIKNRFYEMLSEDLSTTSDLIPVIIKNNYVVNYCHSLLMMFDAEFMMFSSITDNMKIIDRDIIELSFLYYIDNKNMDREESAKFIISGLYIRYLVKAYKDLKDYYFKNNKETMYLEMDKLVSHSNALEKDKKTLESTIEATNNENKRLKKEYKENIEKENILLKNEIEKLNKRILSLEKDKKELVSLTESFFEDPDNSEDIIENQTDIVIPDIKGLIAGGHSNWHDNIKEHLPDSFVYIEGNNERFDEKVLDNKDIVFIYTKFMSHSFYYKLMDRCKRQKIKTVYISSTSPVNLKTEIYKLIK